MTVSVSPSPTSVPAPIPQARIFQVVRFSGMVRPTSATPSWLVVRVGAQRAVSAKDFRTWGWIAVRGGRLHDRIVESSVLFAFDRPRRERILDGRAPDASVPEHTDALHLVLTVGDQVCEPSSQVRVLSRVVLAAPAPEVRLDLRDVRSSGQVFESFVVDRQGRRADERLARFVGQLDRDLCRAPAGTRPATRSHRRARTSFQEGRGPRRLRGTSSRQRSSIPR